MRAAKHKCYALFNVVWYRWYGSRCADRHTSRRWNGASSARSFTGGVGKNHRRQFRTLARRRSNYRQVGSRRSVAIADGAGWIGPGLRIRSRSTTTQRPHASHEASGQRTYFDDLSATARTPGPPEEVGALTQQGETSVMRAIGSASTFVARTCRDLSARESPRRPAAPSRVPPGRGGVAKLTDKLLCEGATRHLEVAEPATRQLPPYGRGRIARLTRAPPARHGRSACSLRRSSPSSAHPAAGNDRFAIIAMPGHAFGADNRDVTAAALARREWPDHQDSATSVRHPEQTSARQKFGSESGPPCARGRRRARFRRVPTPEYHDPPHRPS